MRFIEFNFVVKTGKGLKLVVSNKRKRIHKMVKWHGIEVNWIYIFSVEKERELDQRFNKISEL